ncbi:hypothetical protein Ddye_031667 [Dipteronia dyeriana]|uniref:Uncharacterized protein n=1 Tax=Dipteronia dyeriana TaxID=168575 RepID=A0AAD9TIS4_9ROSI|nr:hypothetical protein Ddye_031667 [Dipteronia dyeriana]
MTGKQEETQTLQEPTQVSTEVPATSSSSPPPTEEETKKWGTHIMEALAVPTAHPDNKIAASWKAGDHQQLSTALCRSLSNRQAKQQPSGSCRRHVKYLDPKSRDLGPQPLAQS